MCSRPAGWRVLADWARLGRPGSRLPLRTSVAGLGGHIVAAARLQLVIIMTIRAILIPVSLTLCLSAIFPGEPGLAGVN